MDQIAHALGIDLYNAMLSHKLKDKTLPKEYYRNRFQKDYDNTFEELIKLGYAEKAKWQDLQYYYVTEIGKIAFNNQFMCMVNYKPKILRDLDYLKHRINFYCDWCNYRFCDDNSKHIITEYLHKWNNGYYVSHTTKDVILKFKNELNWFRKKGLLNEYINQSSA